MRRKKDKDGKRRSKPRKPKPISVRLSAERVGKKLKVTASRDDQPVYVDTIDPESGSHRQRFIAGVRKHVPQVDAPELEAQLMKLPGTVPQDESTQPSPTIHVVVLFTPGPDGRGRLAAEFEGKPIHVDEPLNPAIEKHRRRFLKALAEKRPDADVADAERQLLEISEEIRAVAGTAEPSEPADPLATMPEHIRDAASAMLRDPLLVRRIVEDIAALGVAGECELTTTIYLIGTSRLLEQPLSGIVQGPSASGKSYPITKISELFPPETVIRATRMTPQALFHMPPGTLVHKFIVAGERSRLENDDTAEATRALREMLSSGKLSKLMPIKIGGRIETKLIEQDGPIAFIESTTLTTIFEEDANRCVLLQTDERPEQTRRIYRAVAAQYNGARRPDNIAAIVQRHHAAQRMLKPACVVIPYADQFAELLPAKNVEGRRAISHVLNTVATLALLHQFQRQRDADGRVLATAEDYHVSRWLLDGPIARLLGRRISDGATRFNERLREEFDGQEFTSRETYRLANVSDKMVRNWLNELAEAGFIDVVEEARGRKPTRWRLASQPPTTGEASHLPTVEEMFGARGFQFSSNGEMPVPKGLQAEMAGFSGNVPGLKSDLSWNLAETSAGSGK